MKKILIIFIVVFSCTLLINEKNVYASEHNMDKPLIMVRGSYPINMEYYNYELISSNLNTNVVGEYLNIYQHYETNEIKYKRIYVVDESQIDNKTLYLEKEFMMYENQYISKYLMLDENKFVVVYIEDSIIDEEKVNIYLALIENGEILWKVCLHENIYGSVVDLVVDNNDIYVLVNFYSSYSLMDIYINKYTLEGKYNYSYIYTGDKNDIACDLYVNGENCYITGNTTSELRLCEGKREQEDSFLIVANKSKMEKYEEYTFNHQGIDNVEAIHVIGNYIYIIQSFIDETKGNLPSIKLIQINQDGTILNDYVIDSGYGIKVSGMVELNTTNFVLVYEIYNNYNDMYYTKICNIDVQSTLKNVYEIEYDDIHLHSMFIKDNKISLLYQSNQEGYIYKMYDLIDNIETIDFTYYSEHIDKIIFLDHLNLVTYDNNELCIKKFNVIKVNNFGTDIVHDSKTNIYDYNVYLNGRKGVLNKKQSILEYDVNMFGDYSLLYYIESDSLDIVYNHNIKVINNLSIVNNQTYDVNVELTFNGIGLLNDKQVSSGYKVNNVGDYNLRLIGKDNVEYNFQFKVKKLSLNNNQEDVTKAEVDELNNYLVEKSNEYAQHNIDIEKTNSNDNTSYNWWPMLIPISLSTIGIILILKGVIV